MTNPRYRPAQFSAEPHLFGMTTSMAWNQKPEDDPDRVGAAMRQHEIACAIRLAIRSKYVYVSVYTEKFGLSYDRMNALLKGKVIMRFEDVANAERNLEQKF